MNLSEHPIYQCIYDLCVEIEKLPASEQETKVVVMAADLEKPIAKLLKELKDLKSKAEAMRRALKLVSDWAYKPIDEGGSIPDFAEDIIPVVEAALKESKE